MKAPLCLQDGCNNPTWSGYCHVHSGSKTGDSRSDRGRSTALTPAASMNPERPMEMWVAAGQVFRDLPAEIAPEKLRGQAMETMRAAATAEFYRALPAIATAPSVEERDERAKKARMDTFRALLPRTNTVTHDQAQELAASSSDRFGMGTDEARGLLSYALKAERDMAMATDMRGDVDYGATTEDFYRNIERPFAIAYQDCVAEFFTNFDTRASSVGVVSRFQEPFPAEFAGVSQKQGKWHPGMLADDMLKKVAPTGARQYVEMAAQASQAPPQFGWGAQGQDFGQVENDTPPGESTKAKVGKFALMLGQAVWEGHKDANAIRKERGERQAAARREQAKRDSFGRWDPDVYGTGYALMRRTADLAREDEARKRQKRLEDNIQRMADRRRR